MKKKVASRLRALTERFLRIPKPMHVWKWAEDRRTLPSAVTARSGPYRVKVSPFMQEPQEAFFDPAVQTTVLCMASRVGKTEAEMNLTGYTIDHDPCHVLWVYPTLDSAKKWRKEFFNPMIEHSRCFKGKVRSPRSRDADNTMFSIGFPGGRVAVIGANSPSAFRQIQAPRVICEEVDAMESTVEGDPINLAFKRADNYRESVQVVSSSPTIKGRSRIWGWLEKSDFRKWHVKCKGCEHEFVIMWEHIKWPDDNLSEAAVHCPKCNHRHTDAERKEIVSAGRWIATLPFSGIRGYWLNGFNSLLPQKKGFASRLHQLAAEFTEAKRAGRDALKTVINTVLCECFEEEESEDFSLEKIVGRADVYEIVPLPEGVLLIVAAVDIQKDRIEVEFVGWGRDEERWGLGKHVLAGDPQKEDEIWVRLDALLLQEFESAGGAKMTAERVLVDMQFANQRVLSFCGPRIARGVYPCRGVNRVGVNIPPLLPKMPSRNNRARIPHWNIGVTVAKQTLYARIPLPIPGPRSMHWANGIGYDDDHFRQLTAEKMKKKYQHGAPYFIFEKDNASVRNEAMDLWVYAYAALQTLYPLSWDAYEAGIKRKEEQAAAQAASAGQAVKPPVRRGSWATRW